ncbi:MAG TPA: YHYH protein [Bacteroidia bacterium]|nr:YHYH protein [Bacteroidia bacterium]
MKSIIFSLAFVLSAIVTFSQTNPVITGWLQNTTIPARHYVAGNSTPIVDTDPANCQLVQYSANYSYITTTGLPTYVTGPFLDGNPSVATNQNALFKFPLYPVANSGTPSATTAGNIGLFINGVALFDYRDGVAWNPNTNALCGGPGNPPCPGGMGATSDWNRDAVPSEKGGFDCSKAHPAMGNYHHHQNPSAFNLDLVVISTVCNLYNADGLYAIDSTVHSPLIGFAYDGFPIYGAYAYQNTNGTGPIVRMKSGYALRNITTRTTSPTGASVSAGPPVSTTYPLGYFREDYEFIPGSTSDVLDEHNGRFCVTPEYPAGTYCYFATVDANWNSAYPYVVGPTFYGVPAASKITTISEPVTTYTPSASGIAAVDLNKTTVKVFPNPVSDLIIVQLVDINTENTYLDLYDTEGKLVGQTQLYQGSTIASFDTKTLYAGQYLLKIHNSASSITRKVIIVKD